jgi:hypothetical protein
MAVNSIRQDPASAPLWQQIVSRYHPSFLNECVQAINWSRTMVHGWLCNNMFDGDGTGAETARKIVDYLGDHSITAAHARHIPLSKCEEIGLRVEKLEDDKKLQDLVLTVHHSYMHTFSMSPAIKIVENHIGVATIHMSAMQQVFRAAPGQAFMQVPNPQAPLPALNPAPEDLITPVKDSKLASAPD